MAVMTYPGAVTPLRGLGPFTEAEQEVFWGREREVEELARLVTNDGFRAGLIHGQAGVGKTSLLRAGLIPHLRDHGVVAVLCHNNAEPAAALAAEFSRISNKQPRDGESAVAFLARTASEAMRGQQILFVVDDVEYALATRDDAVIGELADLFARVVTRSGGRARILFACESAEIHTFGILERRTGSLFPPSSRFVLESFGVEDAAAVFERMCALSTLNAEPGVATYVASELNHGGPVKAAELQIAALAMQSTGATSRVLIDAGGGPAELTKTWIANAAESSGEVLGALRLLAQLAQGKGKAELELSWLASRASLDARTAAATLASLESRGVVSSVTSNDGETRYKLAHQTLAATIRPLAAPAQAAAQRAFELLGSKAESKGRLTLMEWLEVRRLRVEPASGEERAVLERTKRFATIAVAVAVAIPVFFLIVMYISNSGSYYMDSASVSGSERVVIRDGRPGLSMFHWLGFGDVVADTGYDARMVRASDWGRIRDQDITFSGDEMAEKSLSLLDERRAALVRYAMDGSESALGELITATEGADTTATTLDTLALIGRGGDKEVELVEKALANDSTSVRISALRLAAAVEVRRPGSYARQIAAALASKDGQERRLAAAVVRSLPDKLARSLSASALEIATDAEAKAELAARVVIGAKAGVNPSRIAAILANPSTDDTNRAAARSALTRLALAKPLLAVPALGDLAADSEAPEPDRIWALEQLAEHSVVEGEGDLQSKLASLAEAESADLKAAALPLLARLAPAKTAPELALMLENAGAPTALRAATALAWGEIAASDPVPAEAALMILIDDRKSEVRAAAARALGKLGRNGQAKLAEMAAKEGTDIARGAAFGLVESARSGGNSRTAVGGIAALWKKKGRSKRTAAEAFAALARTKADLVMSYISSAARDKDDSGLHPIGVEGLCNALAAGQRKAARELQAVASASESVELRRRIGECASDHADTKPADAIRIAETLLSDSDSSVRLEAAQVLASLASDADAAEFVAKKLGSALTDPSRAVRIVAAEAIAALGGAAPIDIGDQLPAVFSRAEEQEKLALLAAAEALGATSLIPLALADPSDEIRSAGLRLALKKRESADTALQSALTDPSPDLRRDALSALAEFSDNLSVDATLAALSLATRDTNRDIADAAVALLARTGAPESVATKLEEMLASRSDADRRAAAVAAREFAEQDPARAAALLVPVLRDPAHDVRAAAAISLGFALAKSLTPAELAGRLGSSESDPAARIALSAALTIKAASDREGTLAALKEIADGGPQLARISARITHGLLAAECDALGFLAYLAP